MRPLDSKRGFSLLELLVATSLFATLMASLVAVYHTTQGFSARSAVVLKANEEKQRDLDVIADVLRGAASASLTGFDAGGVATAPSFQLVTGADAAGRILGPVETIDWRAAATPVGGVGNPGELTLTQGGVTTTLAARVPRNGFVVRRSGNTLRITLTTYYAASSEAERAVATVTGDVSVALRN
jgi:prepilin-type N-terminal cleavage/methylation domain-containing protein